MVYQENDNQSEIKSFVSLPVQIIDLENGVVVVRGCTEFKVIGNYASEAIRSIWAIASEGASKEDILSYFSAPDHETIINLIDKLIEKHILVSYAEKNLSSNTIESNMEIFYWHFGEQEKTATARLNEKVFVILGVNAISRQLAVSLKSAGLSKFSVIDYKASRNQRMFLDDKLKTEEWPDTLAQPEDYSSWTQSQPANDIDCIIATSDFASTPIMRDWNRFCVENKVDFLPVMLRKMVGNVGPFVIANETACYECLMARENTHFDDPVLQRKSELASFYGQAVSGFYPSMASILGDISALELTKFYSGVMRYKVGSLIEVSLLEPALRSRKVLRAPRCPVCSGAKKHASYSLQKSDFRPDKL
jgi:thiazole/oxazole-forming peptide maturase SagC family component